MINIFTKNNMYLLIFLLLLLVMFSASYFVEANINQNEVGARVLGISEEYVNQYFLPMSLDADEAYSKDFFELKNFPQKINNGQIPEVESASVFVYSPQNEYVFAEKNSENAQAIASITKLMTALVFLDINPGWENIYEIKREDRVEGGRIYLYLGDRVRVFDLFNLSLVASANSATRALVSSTGISEEDFVKRMNEKSKYFGLKNTNFVDPIGISSLNVSTAKDLSILIKKAIDNDFIRETTEKSEYSFMTVGGVAKTAYSTDGLLGTYPKDSIRLLGGKTGYIEAAGFCFAGIFKNEEGKEVVSVVLGAKNPLMRFDETDNLVSWVYANFVW